MADVATNLAGPEVYLLPDQITTEEKYERLRGPGNEEEEAKRVERLAAAIYEVGQLDAAIVTPGKAPGSYVLIAGHRRRRALVMINEKRAAEHQVLLKLRCRVDEDKGDFKRKALVSNIQREGFTPMELANIIKDLREENKWEGFSGAKKIAAYLGIDITTVTQHERFLTASKEIQINLHNGSISTGSALELLNVKPEKHAEVLERAQAEQREKNQRLTPSAQRKREKREGEDTTRIQASTLRKAVRNTPDSTQRAVVMSRKELIEAIEQFDGPGYGHIDGAVRQWVSYFTGAFADGKGTNETMRKKFDAMTKGASKGSKEEPAPAEVKAEKDKPARRKRVDAKPKAVKTPKPEKVKKAPKAKKVTKAPKAAKA